MRILLVLIALTLPAAVLTAGTEDTPVNLDLEKMRKLYWKWRRGGELTKAEWRSYRNYSQARNLSLKPTPQTGLPALTELGSSRYRGEDGGLYGGGSDEPPRSHENRIRRALKRVRPLDAGGKRSRKGKVGFVSVGMSNTSMEFKKFLELAGSDRNLSPHLVIVNGAQGGRDAFSWSDDTSKHGRQTWEKMEEAVVQAGMTPLQVQVAWFKHAMMQPGILGEFPDHARVLKDCQVKAVKILKRRCPNVKLVYLTSRIYAGYANSDLNPEPYCYESAFAARWIIRDQIDGKLDSSPVLLWGPYLWADGTRAREKDGLAWKPGDFGKDGTHPSPAGCEKVARNLLKFFKTHPHARSWFAGR